MESEICISTLIPGKLELNDAIKRGKMYSPGIVLAEISTSPSTRPESLINS